MAAVFPIGGVAQPSAKPIHCFHSETNEEAEADTKRARLWPKEQHGRWSGVENLGERRARAVMIPREKRCEMPRGKQTRKRTGFPSGGVAQPPAEELHRPTKKRREMDVDPGPVCQQCHGLIVSPVVVNLCPLCKVDLHTDCLDVHFLLDHQISFERWNKNTLEASLQFALHSAPMAAASSSGCGPEPIAQTHKRIRGEGSCCHIEELEKTAIKELLAKGGVSKASRKLLELVREGNTKAREAADRVSTEYERSHIDIDEDPLGLPFLGHAGHARGEEAMRQIEEAMRRKGKHRMDDAQKETRKKEERERVMQERKKRWAGRPVPWMDEDALEESLVESTTHQ